MKEEIRKLFENYNLRHKDLFGALVFCDDGSGHYESHGGVRIWDFIKEDDLIKNLNR
jgi:hypothetical protein